MAGIYLHIPFCRKACHYCNFHFSTSLHRKPEFLQALNQEISSFRLSENDNEKTPVETIYLGGGTPSLLTLSELEGLLETIRSRFLPAADAEITLEANPDNITAAQLQGWKNLGINRLSIGIQSFRQQDLEWMNRAHNATQAFECIELADAAGFANLNIDLIFGTPTLPDEAWLQNLAQAEKLGITHLSCYALTVEENTALDYFIKKGKVPAPAEEKQARQFEMLMDWAEQQGWEHYEISNLCKPGHRSRHNSNYWMGRPYFGFGPSAHSFNGQNTRWMGVANNTRYINAWLYGEGDAYENETLNTLQLLNERVMTGLRRLEGVPADPATGIVAGIDLLQAQQTAFFRAMEVFLKNGLCAFENGTLTLTKKGKLYADHIAAALFQ